MINHELPQYTVTLEMVMQGLIQSDVEDVLTRDQIVEASAKLFDFPINLTDEDRAAFTIGFCKHFRWRELAVTPFARWKTYLEEFCDNNADFIRSILAEARRDASLFGTVDMVEERDKARSYDRDRTSSTDSLQINDNSDHSTVTSVTSTFPQATLAGRDYASNSDQSETENRADYQLSTTADSDEKEKLNEGENETVTRQGFNGVLSGDVYASALKVFPKLSLLWRQMSYLFYSIY